MQLTVLSASEDFLNFLDVFHILFTSSKQVRTHNTVINIKTYHILPSATTSTAFLGTHHHLPPQRLYLQRGTTYIDSIRKLEHILFHLGT